MKMFHLSLDVTKIGSHQKSACTVHGRFSYKVKSVESNVLTNVQLIQNDINWDSELSFRTVESVVDLNSAPSN